MPLKEWCPKPSNPPAQALGHPYLVVTALLNLDIILEFILDLINLIDFWIFIVSCTMFIKYDNLYAYNFNHFSQKMGNQQKQWQNHKNIRNNIKNVEITYLTKREKKTISKGDFEPKLILNHPSWIDQRRRKIVTAKVWQGK